MSLKWIRITAWRVDLCVCVCVLGICWGWSCTAVTGRWPDHRCGGGVVTGNSVCLCDWTLIRSSINSLHQSLPLNIADTFTFKYLPGSMATLTPWPLNGYMELNMLAWTASKLPNANRNLFSSLRRLRYELLSDRYRTVPNPHKSCLTVPGTNQRLGAYLAGC